jgi:hypothetical protein
MAQVSLNTGELKEFVKQIMNNNRHIQAKGLTPVAINVEGEHGLGKTTVISQIAKEEGIFAGNSAGSAMAGVIQMKDRFKEGDVVVVIFHDHGTRYLGKMFNDEWMKSKGWL